MRRSLYGTLGGLVAFVALVVAVTETRGGGSITDWEVVLAIAAVAAMLAIAALAAIAGVYELRCWWVRRNAHA